MERGRALNSKKRQIIKEEEKMDNDAPLNELDYLIFTVDGQAIYSIGNNIFDASNVKDMPSFLSGLGSSLR